MMSKPMKISKEHEFSYIQIGLNVAYYRKIAGYTQEELAEETGISRTHLANIEAPNVVQTFSIEALLCIADALNIPACKLLEFRD